MFDSNLKAPVAGLAVFLAVSLLSACAGSAPGRTSPATLLEDTPSPSPHNACPGRSKPVCINRLGRKIRCSCMTRGDFEHFFNDH